MAQPHILIVDDDASVRLILERTLARDGNLVTQVSGGHEALKEIENNDFDLVLLDLRMKPIGGLQVLKELRKTNPDIVVIVLTAHGTLDSAVEALRLGAYDYLYKPASPDAIRQRVREGIAHRQVSLRKAALLSQIEILRQALMDLDSDHESLKPVDNSNRFIYSSNLAIDLHHRTATLDNRLLDLTTTEFNILVSLVNASPQAVSPRQLTNIALGYDSEDQEAREIVRWHIHQLRKKIEPDPTKPLYIKTVRYQGYLWSG